MFPKPGISAEAEKRWRRGGKEVEKRRKRGGEEVENRQMRDQGGAVAKWSVGARVGYYLGFLGTYGIRHIFHPELCLYKNYDDDKNCIKMYIFSNRKQIILIFTRNNSY